MAMKSIFDLHLTYRFTSCRLTISLHIVDLCINRMILDSVVERRPNMGDIKMGAIEAKFAELIWENEPVGSGDLVVMCSRVLDWKKSTTYTVLRRLCERGIFQNEAGVVTSLISKKDYYAMQSEQFVEETFDGSLPSFLAAFTTRKKLSKQEIEELEKLIEENRRK